MKITSDDIEWFKKAADTVSKGFYPNGQKAIDDYKRIFADEIAKGTMTGNLNPHCGGCIKRVVQEVKNAIIKLEKELENDKEGIKKED